MSQSLSACTGFKLKGLDPSPCEQRAPAPQCPPTWESGNSQLIGASMASLGTAPKSPLSSSRKPSRSWSSGSNANSIPYTYGKNRQKHRSSPLHRLSVSPTYPLVPFQPAFPLSTSGRSQTGPALSNSILCSVQHNGSDASTLKTFRDLKSPPNAEVTQVPRHVPRAMQIEGRSLLSTYTLRADILGNRLRLRPKLEKGRIRD